MRRAKTALTQSYINKATKLGYTSDAKVPGLNLSVNQGKYGLTKSFILRYTDPQTKKRRELGLGAAKVVTLAMARKRALLKLRQNYERNKCE